jgi:hypothetical protein
MKRECFGTGPRAEETQQVSAAPPLGERGTRAAAPRRSPPPPAQRRRTEPGASATATNGTRRQRDDDERSAAPDEEGRDEHRRRARAEPEPVTGAEALHGDQRRQDRQARRHERDDREHVQTGRERDRQRVAQHLVGRRLSNVELAERSGSRPSACRRRVRALEQAGAIRSYHVDIDPAAIGRGFEVTIHVACRSRTAARSRSSSATARASTPSSSASACSASPTT